MATLSTQEWIDIVTEPNSLRREARWLAHYRRNLGELVADMAEDLKDFWHVCRVVARWLRAKVA